MEPRGWANVGTGWIVDVVIGAYIYEPRFGEHNCWTDSI